MHTQARAISCFVLYVWRQLHALMESWLRFWPTTVSAAAAVAAGALAESLGGAANAAHFFLLLSRAVQMRAKVTSVSRPLPAASPTALAASRKSFLISPTRLRLQHAFKHLQKHTNNLQLFINLQTIHIGLDRLQNLEKTKVYI